MADFTTCGTCGRRIGREAEYCRPCGLAFCSADCFRGHLKLHRLAERAEALIREHRLAGEREPATAGR